MAGLVVHRTSLVSSPLVAHHRICLPATRLSIAEIVRRAYCCAPVVLVALRCALFTYLCPLSIAAYVCVSPMSKHLLVRRFFAYLPTYLSVYLLIRSAVYL